MVQNAMEQELGFNLENDPSRSAVSNQLELIDQPEQSMEGVESSGH